MDYLPQQVSRSAADSDSSCLWRAVKPADVGSCGVQSRTFLQLIQSLASEFRLLEAENQTLRHQAFAKRADGADVCVSQVILNGDVTIKDVQEAQQPNGVAGGERSSALVGDLCSALPAHDSELGPNRETGGDAPAAWPGEFSAVMRCRRMDGTEEPRELNGHHLKAEVSEGTTLIQPSAEHLSFAFEKQLSEPESGVTLDSPTYAYDHLQSVLTYPTSEEPDPLTISPPQTVVASRRYPSKTKERLPHAQSSASLSELLDNILDHDRRPVFTNADDLKDDVRKRLFKRPYRVTDYYKANSYFATVAKSRIFDIFVLWIVSANCIWIAVDTDFNNPEASTELRTVFLLVEQVFCTVFFLELSIRFLAFEEKRSCLRDIWFLFDACLVLLFVLEAWVMPLCYTLFFKNRSDGLGKLSVLRGVRLLRLTRMARITRLLRRMPELMILLKGMLAACRSVFFTLMLLLVVTYVHALALTQLLEGTQVGSDLFSSVLRSMHTLCMFGAFMDGVSVVMYELESENWFCVGVMYCYILVAALTVMNMLVGVLCDVVSAVGLAEKEELTLSYAKARLGRLYRVIKGSSCDYTSQDDEESESPDLSKADFVQMLQSTECCQVMRDLGVDVVGLVDFADVIFSESIHDTEYSRLLTFREFLDIVAQFRGSNVATVKDIVDMRKFVGQSIVSHERKLERILKTLRAQQAYFSRKFVQGQGQVAPSQPRPRLVPETRYDCAPSPSSGQQL
eukprot:TRINITY_DN39602_c0_g1_i1.p1 TRINITY_DN39602_c0_g1~~TRINITY_DN39602_c0_g1_i1.p1  ORF type:complete len:738 (+),score=123.84 TRINITY_DN39602_c0_g1_i1:93-2306(+)